MRIELTVRRHGTDRDVAIDAAPETGLGRIRAAVARVLGVDGSALGPLTGEGTWGATSLRHGAVIDLDTVPGAGKVDGPGALGRSAAPVRVATCTTALLIVGGPDAGGCLPLDRGTFRIGRSSGCDVLLTDPDVSREHAEVTVGTAVTVRDLGSTNGTTVDGAAVGNSPSPIRPGSLLRVGASLLMLDPPPSPDDPPAAWVRDTDGTVQVSRPPRRRPTDPAGTVELPVGAAENRPHAVQWVTALVPAAAGGALAWWTGSLQFLLFTLLSPVMIVSGAVGDRLHWRRSRRRAAADLTRRAAQAAAEISALLLGETTLRRARPPDAAALLRIVCLPTARLWERSPHDDDLLVVRIGSGAVASRATVHDAAGERPAAVLADVPVAVDLSDGPLGLTGPDPLILGVARHVLGQLTALCSPADLELLLLVTPRTAPRWSWLRWVPHHRQPAFGATAGVAEWSAALDELGTRPGGPLRPRILLVIDGGTETGAVPGLSGLLRNGAATGICAVVLAGDTSHLPAACTWVIAPVGDTGSAVVLEHVNGTRQLAVADLVDGRWAEQLARALAPLRDGGDSGTATLPATCTLGQLHGDLDPVSVGAAWNRSRGSAAALVGLGPDGPVELDLTVDGPHALVAGTTGSGKSELLQALVVGLALRQAPSELTVLMIDYKGGAAFGSCARLPHAAGLVTDLDPYLTRRALRSLRSELRRRETLLAAAGVVDLAAYRRTGPPTPVPRLVIVVDEFASLAEELPDFVTGLVAVAQRGRSLGVHLVLATQRPGSAVSPEIRANTALRIALRVTDAGESSDVLGVPDAATIPRSTPGRAWLRAGAVLRPVQGAWPGAVTTGTAAEVRVELLDDQRRPITTPGLGSTTTDLDRVIDTVRAAADRRGEYAARPPWAPVLPDVLPRADLPTPDEPTTVRLALVDLPDEQRREPFDLDLARGDSLLVVGTSRSGRTGTLISVAAGVADQLDPSQVQVYVLDPGGGLRAAVAGLAHCLTSLDGQEPELVLHLLTRLEQACTRRADEPDAQRSPMLLLVDGWDVLLAALADGDAMRCAALLTSLLRIGPAAGLAVVVTGDRTLLAPRVSAGFATRLALRLTDQADYGSLGIAPRDVPTEMPPGRALRAGDAMVVQFGQADGVGAQRTGPAWSTGSTWSTGSGDTTGIRIRPLPRVVHLAGLLAADRDTAGRDAADGGAPDGGDGWFVIGSAGDRCEVLRLDLFHGAGRLLVAGPARSGRSTLLTLLLVQAVSRGLPVVVAAGPRSPLAVLAAVTAGVTLLDPYGPEQNAPHDGAHDDPHRDPRRLPEAPAQPTLLLADDCESWAETPLAGILTQWLRRGDLPLAAVVAGRSDDLATAYRGLGAEARRYRCGILLRPGAVDGELLGVRLPRRPDAGPPGRGVVLGDPTWGPMFAEAGPVAVQIALP